jgi:hypothetical protein
MRHYCIVLAFLLGSPAALAQTTAQTALSFNNSIGVVTHSNWYGSLYDHYSTWKPLLLNAGFKHVRESLTINDPYHDSIIMDLAASGLSIMVEPGPQYDGITAAQDVNY